MKTKQYFNLNQLLALMSLMLLSPALRLFPNAAAESAAQAGPMTAVVSLPFVLLYLRFICVFMDKRRGGEGLSELILRALGPGPGRAALILAGIWMLLYSGFVLRSSADRMITTIYPYASPVVFIAVMSLICFIAALGSARTIVRAAKLILPAVYGVLILILLFGLFSVDRENLLPLTVQDFPPVLKGSLAATDVLSVIIAFSCFFLNCCPPQEKSFKSFSLWAALMLAVIGLLCAVIIGSFGAPLTVRLSWPFFSFVRNIVFFHALERTEAFVVAIWMFPDFLLVSMLIHSSQYALRLAMGLKASPYKSEKLLFTSSKRWVIPLCSLFSALLALITAPEPAALEFWSKKLIPVLNFIFSFVFIPAVYITGTTKKKL